jgi:hypothetical protein
VQQSTGRSGSIQNGLHCPPSPIMMIMNACSLGNVKSFHSTVHQWKAKTASNFFTAAAAVEQEQKRNILKFASINSTKIHFEFFSRH